MKKLLCLTLFIISVFAFSTAQAADLYVSPNGTGNSCSSSNPCSFQTALDIAAANGQPDNIILSAGTYNLSETLTYKPNRAFEGALNIQGAGPDNTIIDGGNSVSLLQIDTTNITVDTASNITLKGITFRNSTTGYYDAVTISTNNASVEVTNCKFIDNQGKGGLGIYSNKSGNITVDSSTFENSNNGLVINTRTGNLNLLNSTFIGDSSGAYIYDYSLGGKFIIKDNTFIDCSSSYDGGGLYLRIHDSLVLSGNYFINNVSKGKGGGALIYIYDMDSSSTLDIINNYFENNTSADLGAGLALGPQWGGYL